MIGKSVELRSEIARAIKSVRRACFGRKCLKGCQRRMAAAAPHPRATRRRWGAAAAAVFLCLWAFVLEGADVQCIWNGSTYVCSGTGSSIEVIGGGNGGPVTVTNVWGVCTNCVMMSPGFCEELKAELNSELDALTFDFSNIQSDALSLESSINSDLADIDTFRRYSALPGTPVPDAAELASFTNYVATVDNTQTYLVRSQNWSSPILQVRYRVLAYSNGIYDYAQKISSAMTANKPYLEEVQQIAGEAAMRASGLLVDVNAKLDCEQCAAGEGNPPGSGSTSITNGNWCTFDQGEAIKELLRDLKTWAQRQHSQLVAISNATENAWTTLREGLFTSYTHIPTEDDLGVSWQDLYLEGYSPNFHEYAATNILARIELLLAGMSGVLTNSSDFAEAGSFAEEGVEATNVVKTVVIDFTNEVASVVEQRERNVRSVGDALVGLYEAFRGWSGTPFSRTTLVNSYSVEIGEMHWDVPSFEPDEGSLWLGNLVRVVCRSVMSVVYILFTVAVFVRFHLAFFQWVFKYLKWAIELMQGLFA